MDSYSVIVTDESGYVIDRTNNVLSEGCARYLCDSYASLPFVNAFMVTIVRTGDNDKDWIVMQRHEHSLT